MSVALRKWMDKHRPLKRRPDGFEAAKKLLFEKMPPKGIDDGTPENPTISCVPYEDEYGLWVACCVVDASGEPVDCWLEEKPYEKTS